jgi:hypothetical protein
MFEATAELSPWIKLDRTSLSRFENQGVANFGGGAPTTAALTDSASAFESGEQYYSSGLSEAQWLHVIRQKIAASTLPPGYESEEAGTWLTQQVAAAALTLIERSSSVFPSAPYLYSGATGDLVAEFEEGSSRTTFIISADSVAAFSVAEGKPIFKRRPLRFWSANQLRIWRDKALPMPSGKNHGTVGS